MDSLRLSQLHDGAVPLEGVLDAGLFRTQAEMLRLIESSPHDQCIDAAAVARRSGAHLCLIVEPCAQSGAKSVGGSLGGKGLTFVAGSVAEPDLCHPTMRGDGRSAQRAAIRRRRGERVRSTLSCLLSSAQSTGGKRDKAALG
jgi:hypothetical protein